MAPELIAGKQYDAKADIWSFGITAIELTQGRAPRSREAPAKVLLKTCVLICYLSLLYSYDSGIVSRMSLHLLQERVAHTNILRRLRTSLIAV